MAELDTVVDQKTRSILLRAQQNEITEHLIYTNLAKSADSEHNTKILERIAREEFSHYRLIQRYTGEELKPEKTKAFIFEWIARIFGLTFGLKLMEYGEDAAQSAYQELTSTLPVLQELAADEERHEKELISIIDEVHLQYIGSMVLGMNDALVELTGALAGLTLAFQNTKLVAAAGLVTGIAASFSMAASEYLSQKSDENSEQNPLTAAFYTGIAYIVTVAFLVAPYLIFSNPYVCLGCTLVNATLVILFFTFYMSIAKGYSFKKRFLEMLGLSMSVAALSFGIGYIIRAVFGVDV